MKFKRGGKKVPNFTQKQRPWDHWQMSYLSIHVKNFGYLAILCVLRKILSSFSLQCVIVFQKRISLEPPSSTPEVDGNIRVQGVFCKKFNSPPFLYEAFFSKSVFFAEFNCKVNFLISVIIIFLTFKYLEPRSESCKKYWLYWKMF